MPLCDVCGKVIKIEMPVTTAMKTLIAEINKQKEIISKSSNTLKYLYEELLGNIVNSFDDGAEELEDGVNEVFSVLDSTLEKIGRIKC